MKKLEKSELKSNKKEHIMSMSKFKCYVHHFAYVMSSNKNIYTSIYLFHLYFQNHKESSTPGTFVYIAVKLL